MHSKRKSHKKSRKQRRQRKNYKRSHKYGSSISAWKDIGLGTLQQGLGSGLKRIAGAGDRMYQSGSLRKEKGLDKLEYPSTKMYKLINTLFYLRENDDYIRDNYNDFYANTFNKVMYDILLNTGSYNIDEQLVQFFDEKRIPHNSIERLRTKATHFSNKIMDKIYKVKANTANDVDKFIKIQGILTDLVNRLQSVVYIIIPASSVGSEGRELFKPNVFIRLFVELNKGLNVPVFEFNGLSTCRNPWDLFQKVRELKMRYPQLKVPAFISKSINYFRNLKVLSETLKRALSKLRSSLSREELNVVREIEEVADSNMDGPQKARAISLLLSRIPTIRMRLPDIDNLVQAFSFTISVPEVFRNILNRLKSMRPANKQEEEEILETERVLTSSLPEHEKIKRLKELSGRIKGHLRTNLRELGLGLGSYKISSFDKIKDMSRNISRGASNLINRGRSSLLDTRAGWLEKSAGRHLRKYRSQAEKAKQFRSKSNNIRPVPLPKRYKDSNYTDVPEFVSTMPMNTGTFGTMNPMFNPYSATTDLSNRGSSNPMFRS